MKLRTFSQALFCVSVLFLFSASQTFAKDVWISVRSKNFFLIGNANEKEIRQAATKLEQFRETFRLLFPRAKFNAPIQTNVVVFKNASSYKPFKPKRGDGKIDEEIAGYFQPGEDLNYITLSVEDAKEDAYSTIFHEYVHFLLNTNFGRADVPPWFNEGLAEYYQTFKIQDDQKVTLGDIQGDYLELLQRQSRLIPLKTLFEIDNYSLQQNGGDSRSFFYAQAWALIHYLMQGNNGANNAALNQFLALVMNKVEPEKAFRQAFQTDYATMEKALKKYVEQRKFQATLVTFKNKLVFDGEMTALPLSEAEANAYLGDLLYRTGEFADAETYLQKALSLDANSTLANASLGLVKMRQNKFDEAKKYLEKAVASDRKSYFALYNYAYILSRENEDEFGYVSKFPPETTKKMRESLQKAIEINPNFTESYRLLAFINLVNNENLDEALALLAKGLAQQPGNQEYSLLIAKIYLRQEKFAEAKEIAQKIVKTAAEDETRSTAQNLLNSINQYEESRAALEKQKKELEAKGVRPPILIRKSSDNQLSDEELAKINRENEINVLNRMIEKPKADEKQVVGYIEKITCAKGEISYAVKAENESFILTSKNFAGLKMTAMTPEAENLAVGCDAQIKDISAVITYRPGAASAKGSLLSLVFVPKFFRLKSEAELAEAQEIIVEEASSEDNRNAQADMERQRKEAMLGAIGAALRAPQEGEKREIGIVEKIECSGQSVFFYVKAETQTLKLKTSSPNNVKFAAFTPEIGQMRIGCGVKMPPVQAVITFRPNTAETKDRQNGEIIAVEFVPKSFVLK